METAAREVRTTGAVIGLSHRRRHGMDGEPNVLVHPVVKFQTEDGRTIEFGSGLGSSMPPKVGEEVEVFYGPSRPEEARIPVGSALRHAKWPFIIAAVFIVIPAALVLLFSLFFVLIFVVSLL